MHRTISTSPSFNRQVKRTNKKVVASTRCAQWDLLCQADWVITIQDFWGRYGDRQPLDWPRMLSVYQACIIIIIIIIIIIPRIMSVYQACIIIIIIIITIIIIIIIP